MCQSIKHRSRDRYKCERYFLRHDIQAEVSFAKIKRSRSNHYIFNQVRINRRQCDYLRFDYLRSNFCLSKLTFILKDEVRDYSSRHHSKDVEIARNLDKEENDDD